MKTSVTSYAGIKKFVKMLIAVSVGVTGQRRKRPPNLLMIILAVMKEACQASELAKHVAQDKEI